MDKHKPMMRRRRFVITSTVLLLESLAMTIYLGTSWGVLLLIVIILSVMGYIDMFQKRHTVRRIFEVVGRMRYIIEEVRANLYQYFIESDTRSRRISWIERCHIY